MNRADGFGDEGAEGKPCPPPTVASSRARYVDLEALVRGASGDDQLVHLERLPARAARLGAPIAPLPPGVLGAAPPGGLWTHQATAIDLVRNRRSVAVATGTASGKSLIYQLPIAEAVTADRSTALCIYPTKALAQDQLRAFGSLGVEGMVAVTYDGDTDGERRAWARRHANVFLTNPDMLHASMLPHHARFADLFSRLRYVVLDELHTLRGVFGTHVAHVVRRLRRLCAHYGSDPTFICSSATLGAPAALAAAICGVEVTEITDDGSPRGERLFALWNPPLVDEVQGRRASANAETARLLAAFVRQGFRGIAFTRSRKSTELVASYARTDLEPALAARVRPYRGGYLADERREIEAELFDGRLLGVAATNALELGVDVGGLDACILNGFPGTIASMWQQAGRAGRAQQRSIAVLVAGADALDQWLMAHPTEVFTRSPEPAVVNPANPFVLLPHLACAAYELPLRPEDERWWEPPWLPDGAFEEAVTELVAQERLAVRGGRVVHVGFDAPARSVGLRTGTSGEFRIVAETEDGSVAMIGVVDESRAFETIHPGAVYLHQGQQYRVERLDLADRAAWVTGADTEEFTQPRTVVDIAIGSEDESRMLGDVRLSLGAVDVTHHVVAYQRRSLATFEVLGTHELQLPPTQLTTRAFWLTLPARVLGAARLDPLTVPGALHAAEHGAIGMLPLFTICDRWDVGGVSTAAQAQTGEAMIFVYDGYPGGAGIAELGYRAGPRLLQATAELIARCPCEAGCPSCVQSPKCGNWNEPLEKSAAVALLAEILGGVRRP